MNTASDFSNSQSSFKPLLENQKELALSVGAVTLLGFGEACLRCRMPVPLTLVGRFALVNIIPSIVWRTLDLPLLCKSAKISLSEVLEPTIASELLRASRYFVASYSALNCLLNWREEVALPIDESVLRLTTKGSQLTPYSMKKHSTHIVPMEANCIANDTTQLRMQQWCLHHKDVRHSDIFLMEVDLSATRTRLEAKEAMTSVRHVINPFRGSRALSRRIEALVVLLTTPYTAPELVPQRDWDICVNTASIIATNVLDFVRQVDDCPDGAPILIHTDTADQFIFLAQGLLQANKVPIRFIEGMDPSNALHVIAFPKESNSIERLNVLLDQGDHIYCVDLTLEVEVAKSSVCIVSDTSITSVPSGVTILHTTNLFDQVLQHIREQLRVGMSSNEIQDSLRARYGPMNSLTPGGYRRDKYSFL